MIAINQFNQFQIKMQVKDVKDLPEDIQVIDLLNTRPVIPINVDGSG